MNKTSSVRKSVAISLLSSNSLTILGILSSMVLARLLKPAEVGTYAVAAVIITLAQQFRDFGTSNYIVQSKELTNEALSKALGLSIIAAWSIGTIMLLASPLAMLVYQSKEILEIFYILVLNFFLIPFGSNTLALLRRDLRFKERAIIDHASALTSIFTSLLLAWAGFGAKSLAWAAVCSTLATIASSMLFRPPQYRWKVSFKGVRQIAKYGASVTASSLMANVNSGLVELISGRMVGLQVVGLYNKARSVTDLINNIIFKVAEQVALPVMSRHYHAGGNIVPMYLRSVSIVTGLAWPACAFAALFPAEIIQVMFGSQWGASVPMLRTLCLLAIFTSTSILWAYALFAVGEVHRVFKGEVVLFVSTATILVCLLTFHTTENLALAVVATAPAGQYYIYRQLHQALGFKHRDFLKMCLCSGIVLAMSICFPFALYILNLYPANSLFTLLIAAPMTGIGWLIGLFVAKHPLMNEIQTAWSLIRQKFA